MTKNISKNRWPMPRRSDERHIELTQIELFLDFDPVSPDWPPDDGDEAVTERVARQRYLDQLDGHAVSFRDDQ